MQKMPLRSPADAIATLRPAPPAAGADWQRKLPTLRGGHVALREMRASDGPSLFALLASQEVSRFISPPPSSVEGFERFIAWAERQRAAGAYACYAVTLDGFDTAIGIFQIRRLDATFDLAEWGFALGAPFWGSGVFEESAKLVLDFAFGTLGVRRLEARAAVANGRGNGALVKIGAVQEAILRRSFARDGLLLDQVLYAIVPEDRRAAWRPPARVFAHVH
jgi:RimJ/RimL family protein N-acetyltransferase